MTFASGPGLKNLEQTLINRDHFQRLADIDVCRSLLELLADPNKPGTSFVKQCPVSQLFRLTASPDPLDAAATFGNGGRVNLGLAQQCQEFKDLKASYGV